MGCYSRGKGLAAVLSLFPRLHNTWVMEWLQCQGSISTGKSEAPPKPRGWEIDAPATSVGMLREVWCLKCACPDKTPPHVQIRLYLIL